MPTRKKLPADCPKITFTSDFQEFTQGYPDFSAGDSPCLIRYDPLRLMEESSGAGDTQIRAHLRFHPSNAIQEMVLKSAPRPKRSSKLADDAGGAIYESAFDIPSGTEALEAWFSCAYASGHMHWDSRYGQNYWLRFNPPPAEILAVRRKPSRSKKAPGDRLELDLALPKIVDAVQLRWRCVEESVEGVVDLSLQGPTEIGTVTWTVPSGGLVVPKGCTILFDLRCHIGTHAYVDDLHGDFYSAG